MDTYTPQTPLNQQLADEKAKALRALADLENMRRRESAAKAQWGNAAVAGFVRGVAPGLFALQKAADHTTDSDTKNAITAFMESLQNSGLTAINPSVGTPVNGERHEVLMAAEGEPGTIVQVLEAGWDYNGIVVQPAKVSAAPEL